MQERLRGSHHWVCVRLALLILLNSLQVVSWVIHLRPAEFAVSYRKGVSTIEDKCGRNKDGWACGQFKLLIAVKDKGSGLVAVGEPLRQAEGMQVARPVHMVIFWQRWNHGSCSLWPDTVGIK